MACSSSGLGWSGIRPNDRGSNPLHATKKKFEKISKLSEKSEV